MRRAVRTRGSHLERRQRDARRMVRQAPAAPSVLARASWLGRQSRMRRRRGRAGSSSSSSESSLLRATLHANSWPGCYALCGSIERAGPFLPPAPRPTPRPSADTRLGRAARSRRGTKLSRPSPTPRPTSCSSSRPCRPFQTVVSPHSAASSCVASWRLLFVPPPKPPHAHPFCRRRSKASATPRRTHSCSRFREAPSQL